MPGRVRQHDALGTPVVRIGLAADVAEALEVVDELAHRLRRHVGAGGDRR
jgi:hypothetical protein